MNQLASVLRVLALVFALGASTIAQKAPLTIEPNPDPFVQCEDRLETRVEVNAKHATPFFKKAEMHHPWWVLEHDDGHLESTHGKLDAEDRTKIEWTSNCLSNHQGDRHRMERCWAALHGEELRLHVWGGLPAYFLGLFIKIRGDQFTCAFDANYPDRYGASSQFRITKKQLHVRQLRARAGERYYAWLSIEFEEGFPENGVIEWEPRKYKVEGFIKPIVPKPAPAKAPKTKKR